MARLDAEGYRQYEISNLARPGRESRHNLKYWTDGEWLGFGPGAHATWRGVRWKTVAGTADYAARIEAGEDARVERRVLSPDDRWREAIMMGLRLVDGISLSAFQSVYGLDLEARYGDDLRRFREAGLVADDDGRIRLTGRGRLLANEVLAVFF
jgi:oxygen-independent coproporphyrinogen-3 oxidase